MPEEKIVKAIDYDVLTKGTTLLWRKTNDSLHLLFCFIAYGDLTCGQQFFETNKNKIEELGLAFIGILPEQSIALFEKGVKLRLFENCWDNETFFALKELHNVSESKYKEILEREFPQLSAKINEFCILDFIEKGKTLYDILAYIKETHQNIIPKLIPLLDFSKIKKEKQRMLKDDRCDRRCKKHFQDMLDILIEFAEEPNISELNSIRSLVK